MNRHFMVDIGHDQEARRREEARIRAAGAIGTTIAAALLALAVALIIITSSGCAAVSHAAKHELATGISVGDGVILIWDQLRSDDKKEAYWKSIRVLHDLDLSINGTPVPAGFLDDPFAPITSSAATAPIRSGGGK